MDQKQAEIWKEVLAAHDAVAKANEQLRRALTRMEIHLDQKES